MIKLKLETNTEEEKLIKEYLENNASETLADKINNGTKIIKDNKQLLNKKDLKGFLNYASEEAKKLVEKEQELQLFITIQFLIGQYIILKKTASKEHYTTKMELNIKRLLKLNTNHL